MRTMKSTLLWVLLLALCCQLARANEVTEEKIKPADDSTELPEVSEDGADEKEEPIEMDVAEEEAKLMSKYADLISGQTDSQPKKQGNWFTNLFNFGAKDKAAPLADDYKRINDELVKRTDDKSVEKNFDIVLEWYQADGKDDKRLAEALGHLASLAELTGDNKCNLESERILKLNNQATEGRAWKKGEEHLRNRVDDIVRFFMSLHEKECLPVYKQKFREIMSDMSDQVKSNVHGMLTDDYISSMATKNRDLLIDLMLSDSDIDGTDGKQFQAAKSKLTNDIYNHLKQLTIKYRKKNFIVNRTDVNKAKLNKLMDEALVKPCKRYVALLGPDVYIPYSFDMSVSDSFFKREMDGELDFHFAFGLMRFEICEFILRAEKSVKAQLFDVATEALKLKAN